MDGPAVNQVIDDLKRLEHEGYHFEAADASLELLMRRAPGGSRSFFRVESMRVITDELPSGDFTTEATVKVWVGDGASATCTPPRATARSTRSTRRCAPRSAGAYPQLDQGAPDRLQGAHPRRRDGHRRDHPGAASTPPTASARWTTIGVSANIIEASWRALEESIVYGLLHAHVAQPVGDGRTRRRYGRAEVRPRPRRPRRCAATSRPTTSRGAWMPDRPARDRRLPARGAAAGLPGPGPGLRDQDRQHVPADRVARCQPGERCDDAVRGCLGIALRRASMFSRAPVVHDLTIAFTIWGFLDRRAAGRAGRAPARRCSKASANVPHHYDEARATRRPSCPRPRCG